MSQFTPTLVDKALINMANRGNRRQPNADERLRQAQQNLSASTARRAALSESGGVDLSSLNRNEIIDRNQRRADLTRFAARRDARRGGGLGGLGARTGLGAAASAVTQGALGQVGATGAATTPPSLSQRSREDLRRRQDPFIALTTGQRPVDPRIAELEASGHRQAEDRARAIEDARVIGRTARRREEADARNRARSGLGGPQPRPETELTGIFAPDNGAAAQAGPLTDVRLGANRDRLVGRSMRPSPEAEAAQRLTAFRSRGREMEAILRARRAASGGSAGPAGTAASRLDELRGGGFVSPADFQNPAINRGLQSAAGRAALRKGRRARVPVQRTRENDPELAARVEQAETELAQSEFRRAHGIGLSTKKRVVGRSQEERAARRKKKLAHREDVKTQLQARSLSRRARANTLRDERLARIRTVRDAKSATKAREKLARSLNVSPAQLFALEQHEKGATQAFIQELALKREEFASLSDTAKQKFRGQVVRALGAGGSSRDDILTVLQMLGVQLPGLDALAQRAASQPERTGGQKTGKGRRVVSATFGR